MNEAATWKWLKPLLKGTDPIRVENAVCPGTPDVNCTLGWIELKYMDRDPQFNDKIFKMPHFRPAQRAWLLRRRSLGGRAFVLLRTPNSVHVWDAHWAALNLGKVSGMACYQNAIVADSIRKLDNTGLVRALGGDLAV